MVKTVKQMTIDKLSSGSGQERIEGEKLGLSLLKYSPIVGIGLGSYRTFSLGTNVLLNMGAIRTSIIIIHCICSIKGTYTI